MTAMDLYRLETAPAKDSALFSRVKLLGAAAERVSTSGKYPILSVGCGDGRSNILNWFIRSYLLDMKLTPREEYAKEKLRRGEWSARYSAWYAFGRCRAERYSRIKAGCGAVECGIRAAENFCSEKNLKGAGTNV